MSDEGLGGRALSPAADGGRHARHVRVSPTQPIRRRRRSARRAGSSRLRSPSGSKSASLPKNSDAEAREPATIERLRPAISTARRAPASTCRRRSRCSPPPPPASRAWKGFPSASTTSGGGDHHGGRCQGDHRREGAGEPDRAGAGTGRSPPLEPRSRSRSASRGPGAHRSVTLPILPSNPVLALRKNFGGDLSDGATATFDLVMAAPDGRRLPQDGVVLDALEGRADLSMVPRGRALELRTGEVEPPRRRPRRDLGRCACAQFSPRRPRAVPPGGPPCRASRRPP